MRYILLSLLFFQFLIATENLKITEESIFEKQAQIQAIIDEEFPIEEEIKEYDDENIYSNKILENDDVEFSSNDFSVEIVTPIEELFKEAQIDSSFVSQGSSKNLYVNYEKTPKIVFKNQRFKISLKSTITTDEFDKIETRFLNQKNLKVLNPQDEWSYGNKNNFYNTYYFKVQSEDFVMPKFQILMYQQGKISEISTLNPKRIKFTNVAQDKENFSNVIAKDLEIVTHKTKQYTNNKLLTILELRANQGNLEDFSLKNIKEQGVSSIEEDGSKQVAIYYAIIPIHKKQIFFEYYNSDTNSFNKVKSEVILTNELVSTQTDLNPNKSNVLYYKKLTTGLLATLFFLLFLVKRKFVLIFFALIFLIIYILYNLPNEIVKVKTGSNIYILPTKKSTVFYKISKIQNVEILSKKEEYFKILFKKSNESKKIIGWVKEQNIVKN